VSSYSQPSAISGSHIDSETRRSTRRRLVVDEDRVPGFGVATGVGFTPGHYHSSAVSEHTFPTRLAVTWESVWQPPVLLREIRAEHGVELL